jgi:hypothetical protein
MPAKPFPGSFSLVPHETSAEGLTAVLLECRAFASRIKAGPGEPGISIHYVDHKIHVSVATAAVYRAGPGKVPGLGRRDADLCLMSGWYVDPQAEALHRQAMADVVGDQDKLGHLALLQRDLARHEGEFLDMYNHNRRCRLLCNSVMQRAAQAHRQREQEKTSEQGGT